MKAPLLLLSIFDSISETYAAPFTSLNKNTAIRSFKQVANDPATTINKSPNDYTLVVVADWDDLQGKIIVLEPFETIAKASNLIEE